MYLCGFLYLSLVLLILGISFILGILCWSPRARSKCRDHSEISAFRAGPRLEICVFMYVPLFKPNIINIRNINDIGNIVLAPQDPPQMQRSQ